MSSLLLDTTLQPDPLQCLEPELHLLFAVAPVDGGIRVWAPQAISAVLVADMASIKAQSRLVVEHCRTS
jgi:hypothetical protein